MGKEKKQRDLKKFKPTGEDFFEEITSDKENEFTMPGNDAFEAHISDEEDIFEQLSSPNANSREAACISISSLILRQTDGESLLVGPFTRPEVLRKIIKLLVDPEIFVRTSAAGSLKNAIIAGESEICKRLVDADITTLLLTAFSDSVSLLQKPQIHGSKLPFSASDSSYSSANFVPIPDRSLVVDNANEILSLLTALCENNENATLFVTKQLKSILQLCSSLLTMKEGDLYLAVSSFLLVLSDDNDDFVKTVSDQYYNGLLLLFQNPASALNTEVTLMLPPKTSLQENKKEPGKDSNDVVDDDDELQRATTILFRVNLAGILLNLRPPFVILPVTSEFLLCLLDFDSFSVYSKSIFQQLMQLQASSENGVARGLREDLKSYQTWKKFSLSQKCAIELFANIVSTLTDGDHNNNLGIEGEKLKKVLLEKLLLNCQRLMSPVNPLLKETLFSSMEVMESEESNEFMEDRKLLTDLLIVSLACIENLYHSSKEEKEDDDDDEVEKGGGGKEGNLFMTNKQQTLKKQLPFNEKKKSFLLDYENVAKHVVDLAMSLLTDLQRMDYHEIANEASGLLLALTQYGIPLTIQQAEYLGKLCLDNKHTLTSQIEKKKKKKKQQQQPKEKIQKETINIEQDEMMVEGSSENEAEEDDFELRMNCLNCLGEMVQNQMDSFGVEQISSLGKLFVHKLKDQSIQVQCLALDCLFDLFKDTKWNSVFVDLQMPQLLKEFLKYTQQSSEWSSSNKRHMNSRLSNFQVDDDDKQIEMMKEDAIVNLKEFIEYKKDELGKK